MSKGIQIAIGASLVVLLLGWYGYTNLSGQGSFHYYQTLDELLGMGRAAEGHALRVHGYVANDSIVRSLEKREVRFSVQNDPPHGGAAPGRTLAVVYDSLETPDLFKDGAEVVVEGRLKSTASGEPVLMADNVLAKCPSKFQAKARAGETPPARGGSEVPL